MIDKSTFIGHYVAAYFASHAGPTETNPWVRHQEDNCEPEKIINEVWRGAEDAWVAYHDEFCRLFKAEGEEIDRDYDGGPFAVAFDEDDKMWWSDGEHLYLDRNKAVWYESRSMAHEDIKGWNYEGERSGGRIVPYLTVAKRSNKI